MGTICLKKKKMGLTNVTSERQAKSNRITCQVKEMPSFQYGIATFECSLFRNEMICEVMFSKC